MIFLTIIGFRGHRFPLMPPKGRRGILFFPMSIACRLSAYPQESGAPTGIYARATI